MIIKRIAAFSLIIFLIFCLGALSGCASSKSKLRDDKDEEKAKTAKKYSKDVRLLQAKDLNEENWKAENYRIDVDDVLDISVWQIEELRQEVVVRPDGKISFPLIGDVQAQGLTLDELRQDIVDKIKLYIKAPQVSVNIRELGGKRVAILGDVANPGVARFTAPIRLTEAIALAGGFTKTATKGAVFVIRDMYAEQPTIIVSDISKLVFQGDLRENIVVHQGDVIYVQTSMLSSMREMISDFMDTAVDKIIVYFERYYGFGWNRYLFTANKGTKWQIPQQRSDY